MHTPMNVHSKSKLASLSLSILAESTFVYLGGVDMHNAHSHGWHSQDQTNHKFSL